MLPGLPWSDFGVSRNPEIQKIPGGAIVLN
jgi:hypothetical protein